MGSLVIVLVLVLAAALAACGIFRRRQPWRRYDRSHSPRATDTDAATGNDRDSTCEVELTIGQGKGEATIQTGPRSCLLVPRIIVHRTEPIKLLDFNVVGSSGL